LTKARDVATQGGMVLINSTTVSASSGIQINNLFSSTYDQYFMSWTGVCSSNAVALFSRFSASGTPNSSTLYFYGGYSTNNSTGPTREYAGSQAQTILGALGDISGSAFNYINNPFLASPTNGTWSYDLWGSSSNFVGQGGFSHNNAVSYDGIYIYPGSGTFTGTLKFYGVKK
jgi:hypothetical protein